MIRTPIEKNRDEGDVLLITKLALSRGRWHFRRSMCAAFLLLAVCTSAAGCKTNEGQAGGDAPRLSVGNPNGGNGLYAPPSKTWTGRWSGSIGGHVLCSTDGTPVTLKAVRYNFIKKPQSVVGLVRTVPAASDGQKGGVRTPIGSTLGSPPEFDEPYADLAGVKGSFTPVAGVVVERACGPRKKSDGFQEFFTVMTVDETGGHTKSAEIDYEVEEVTETLTIEWEMSACGTSIDPDLCPP